MATFVKDGVEYCTIDDTVARALVEAGYVKKGEAKPEKQPAEKATEQEAPKPKRASRAKAKATE